jgi:hypothetical protein
MLPSREEAKKTLDLENLTTTKTFFNLIGIIYVGTELFSKTVRLWCGSGFSNRYPTFVFKFFNNILGINVRTSHFGLNATRYCFFCTKDRNLTLTKAFCIYFLNVQLFTDGMNPSLTNLLSREVSLTLTKRKSFYSPGFLRMILIILKPVPHSRSSFLYGRKN